MTVFEYSGEKHLYYAKSWQRMREGGKIIDLSNSTREAVQDGAACAKHNIPRIEIHTIDSDPPVVRQECNVSGKVLPDFYPLMQQQNEY
jgi:hypothetical protein